VLPPALIACGNTAEAVIAALLVRRFADASDLFAKTTAALMSGTSA
jgi:hypothetical protein